MVQKSMFKTQLDAAATPMLVLLADDHFASRLLSQSLLQREGHEVTLVEDGKQAVQACKNKVFDLILLDIQMPVMNGFEALKWIKAIDNGNETAHIFALTAHSHLQEIRTIMSKGFGAVLQKPFRVAEMMRYLERPYKTHVNRATTLAVQDNTEQRIYLDVMELPLLETQTLDILLGAVGQKRMCKILAAYWNDADTMVKSLKSTRITLPVEAEKELIKLRKTAHGLKGASANIGLLKASRLAAKLQNAPMEDIPFLVETTERTLNESQSALRDYCGLAGEPTDPKLAKAS